MMSPTVEPFIVFGYVTFYFGPYFPAIWILRKMQAKRGPEAFVSRHPLISLGALVLVIGFIFDAMLEISLVRTGLYIYSQAIPFGTLFAGTTFQFPLIWESLSVTFVMIPAAILSTATTRGSRWRRSSPRRPSCSRRSRCSARSW